MIETLIGAIVAIASVWFGLRWQAKHNASTLAAALLAELEAVQALDREGRAERLHRGLIHSLQESGRIEKPEVIGALFGYSPADGVPVYHASLPHLGLLPSRLARGLIEYHATFFALTHLATRLLGRDLGLPVEAVQDFGRDLERQYDEMLDRRHVLVRDLREYLGQATPAAGGAAEAVAAPLPFD